MQAIQVQTTVTELAPAGNRDFLHIFNNSDVVIYVSWDGTNSTVAGGWPLYPNGGFTLDNTGPRTIFNKRVTAIHGGSGDKEVRIQGA